MTTSSAPRSLPGWRNQLASISSPMPTGWPSWVTVPSKHCGVWGPRLRKGWQSLGSTPFTNLHTDSGLLMSTFGPRTALWLLLAKCGGDTEVSAQAWVPRSRSHAVTFPRDLTCRSEMESAVTELAQRTLNEVVASSRTVTRVAVTVRTATFYTRTKIRKLQAPSTDPDVITAAARHVLDLFELDRPVRLLGVRLELA